VTDTLSLAEQLLDVEAAAKLLNVKPSTVYEWVRSGAMPCLRLGPRAIRFTRPMLEAWLADRLDPGRP
jgi:excisionase family DNA binding protein